MARQCDHIDCGRCKGCGACGNQSAHYPSCRFHGYDVVTGKPHRDPEASADRFEHRLPDVDTSRVQQEVRSTRPRADQLQGKGYLCDEDCRRQPCRHRIDVSLEEQVDTLGQRIAELHLEISRLMRPGDPQVNVKSCARCGRDHVEVPFKQMQRPLEQDGGPHLTHWAPCPWTGDPILMYVSD